MAAPYLKLDTRRATKDNLYPILIWVGMGKFFGIPTGLHCKAEHWDESTKKYTGPQAKQFNDTLSTLLSRITIRILELKEKGIFDKLSKGQIKIMLRNDNVEDIPNVAQENKRTLCTLFNHVCKIKNKRTSEIYESTLRRLSIFCNVEEVTFDTINRFWLDEFVASMSDLSVNTRSIHLRNLRAVNNYALDCELTKSYPFRRYKMPKQTSRHKSFSVDILRNLSNLKLGHNSIYRDIFMLTFYLIGINFIDLCNLDEITNEGRVEYYRAKTHKRYSIKVEAEAKAIIDRYKGKTHLLYMLDNHKDYRSYYRQLRRGLEAVKVAYNITYPDLPIKELTTYWARHSWATIAASLEIPKETISAALGHELGSSITSIYINFDRKKIDDANRKVIDWLKNSEKNEETV